MSHRDESNPEALFARETVGAVLDGEVVDVKPFGAFVELAAGVHGLLHESEWTEPPRLGATVRVEVLDVDPDHRRMSLSNDPCSSSATDPSLWRADRSPSQIRLLHRSIHSPGLGVEYDDTARC